jgi:hypothetical protein
MASENLNVGTAANANNGDTLRAAFIKVKKMFAEIYGQTYDEQGDLSGTDFKVDASRMETTNTPASGLDGYVMTYDHSTGGFTFEEYFNGDITRVQGGSGLSGDTASGEATINIDLNDLTEAALDVANDDIAFVDTSDSNTTKKESIADIMSAVAGSGITAVNGVLNVSVDTGQIANDAVDGTKLEQFDDSLTAATSGDILVSNGTDFIHSTMSGDATIASGGALSLADNLQLGGNESLGVPSGTTTQRNAITTPAAGMFRFNTTDSQFEGYDGTEWGEIGGGGATLYVDTFDGDGSDTTFDLSQSISSENDTQVYIDGVYQSKSTYSTSGTTITFSEAPATGTDNIEVIHIKAIANTTVPDGHITTAKLGADAVTYAKLADEFTTRDSNVTLASGSASKDIDFDSKAVYEVTLPTGNVAVTLNFDGADIGMTKVILIKTQSSAYTGTITFSQTTGTGTFVRLSSDDIVKDASTTNYVQATCIDKSGDNCTFIYTVGTAQS